MATWKQGIELTKLSMDREFGTWDAEFTVQPSLGFLTIIMKASIPAVRERTSIPDDAELLPPEEAALRLREKLHEKLQEMLADATGTLRKIDATRRPGGDDGK